MGGFGFFSSYANEVNMARSHNEANHVLDKGVSKHIKSKNYAARQKSRLAKAVNGIK